MPKLPLFALLLGLSLLVGCPSDDSADDDTTADDDTAEPLWEGCRAAPQPVRPTPGRR